MSRFGRLCSTRPRGRSIAPERRVLRGAGRVLLLVSVADANEAAEAIAAGADILDLKDPRRGPLGACDAATLREVAALRDRRAPRLPLSAAVGPAREEEACRIAALAAAIGYDAVKTGLEGLADPAGAIEALACVASRSRDGGTGVLVVAATYADAGRVAALPHPLLPAVAARAGCDGCLLDTAIKDGATIASHLVMDELRAFAGACRSAGMLCALAGSITIPLLPDIVAAGPDLIGARGALCAGGRTGRLDADRLREFRSILVGRAAGRPRAAPASRRPGRRAAGPRLPLP